MFGNEVALIDCLITFIFFNNSLLSIIENPALLVFKISAGFSFLSDPSSCFLSLVKQLYQVTLEGAADDQGRPLIDSALAASDMILQSTQHATHQPGKENALTVEIWFLESSAFPLL